MRTTQGRGFIGTAPLALSVVVFAVTAAVALAARGSLTFVEQQKDGVGGVDGLDQAISVATSPDGRHVYATGGDDNAVAAFSRAPGSGALTFIEQERDGVGGVNGIASADGVAVSPDGRHVYVTGFGDDAVAGFARDTVSGGLSFIGAQMDGVGGVQGLAAAEGVAVSPDGLNVYVAAYDGDSVVTFSRDSVTGALTFIDRQQDGVGGADGLDGASYLVVTPDGKNLYVAGNLDNAVAAFARDPASGVLSFRGHMTDGAGGVDGIDGAFGIDSSPDGENIYVTGFSEDSLAVLVREPVTGELGFREVFRDGAGGVDGLDGAIRVAASPDGGNVYVTGRDDNAVATFAREPAGGTLTFLEFDQDGAGGVDGLEGASGVEVPCDGRNVQTASLDDDAIAVFSREGAAPGTCAPDLELFATKQKIDKAIEALATCDIEACTVEVEGKLKGVRKKPRVKPDTQEIEFEEDQPLSLGLGKRARRKAKDARKEGRKVFAKLTATATDLAGNDALPETVKIKLK